MRTNSKKLNEKKCGLAVVYYRDKPITLQCPDSQELDCFLLELSIALSDAVVYNRDDNYPNIANANSELRSKLRIARQNIAYL